MDKEIWRTLDDIFLDESDRWLFENYLSDPSAVLMEMANMRGIDIRTDNRLPFSFYFSTREVVRNAHGIRVKLIWNPSKAPENADGYLELHGNYEYISGSHKYKPTAKELKIARDFFHKYKVFFAAVWEGKVYDGYLQAYFRSELSLKEFLSKFENMTERQYYELNHCSSVKEVEECVRKYKIFNMND